MAMAVALLLSVAACNKPDLYSLRGTLYTDSTCSTPIAGAKLSFVGECFEGYVSGTSTTDGAGRFAFSYWQDGADAWEDNSVIRPKLSAVEYLVQISYNNEILWISEANDASNMRLWPGCKKYNGYNWRLNSEGSLGGGIR